MARLLFTPSELPAGAPSPARRRARSIALASAGLAGLLLLAGLVLWFHYGTAVFFEMIAAGFAACF